MDGAADVAGGADAVPPVAFESASAARRAATSFWTFAGVAKEMVGGFLSSADIPAKALSVKQFKMIIRDKQIKDTPSTVPKPFPHCPTLLRLFSLK